MKDLSTVKRGVIRAPKRIVLYGPEGIGKSTWASHAPDAIFLGSESGTEQLDVFRIPKEELKNWGDVLDWLDSLGTGDHSWKTLVIDSLDWLEGWLWKFIARREQKDSIEDIQYAGGYKKAVEDWRDFVARLDWLRDNAGMHIVLIAHSKISRFSDPAGEEWDRYSLAIDDAPKHNAAAVIRQWADELYFTVFDQKARKKGKWDSKGTGSDQRWIYTHRSPAYDAKTRAGFNPKIPLDGATYWKHVGDPTYKGPDVQDEVDQDEAAKDRAVADEVAARKEAAGRRIDRHEPGKGVEVGAGKPDPAPSSGRQSQPPNSKAAQEPGTTPTPGTICDPPPFEEEVDEREQAIDDLKVRIRKDAKKIDPAHKETAKAFLKKAGDDLGKLEKLAGWVGERLAAKNKAVADAANRRAIEPGPMKDSVSEAQKEAVGSSANSFAPPQ